jgi:hypothetical protein
MMGSHDRNGARHGVGGGHSPVVPFLLGTAVGGLAGAVVGTLLSGHALQLFTTLIDVVERRGDEDNHPKFELLLQ